MPEHIKILYMGLLKWECSPRYLYTNITNEGFLNFDQIDTLRFLEKYSVYGVW